MHYLLEGNGAQLWRRTWKDTRREKGRARYQDHSRAEPDTGQQEGQGIMTQRGLHCGRHSQTAVLAAAHTRAFHGDFEPGAASHFGIFNCLPSLTNSIVPRALEAILPEWVPLHR